MRPLLGVNIDHVATLRQARGTRYPDPVQAAMVAEEAGAEAITVHLREDRRHIQERDLWILRDTLLTRMNLELAVTDEMVAIAEKISPADCCLVPERRQELTTEGGLDVVGQPARISAACQRLKEAGVRVSLFIDPDPAQLEAAAKAGAPVVELHTGSYADAPDGMQTEHEFQRVREAARVGKGLGLIVNGGHGLNYQNVQPVAAMAEIEELNIGHAIIARAIFSGLGPAVREMKQLLAAANKSSI